MDSITTHTATDGTVYLRTQHGLTSAEIAEALTPYIGRTMQADVPNNYGHYKRYRVVLKKVDGDKVTLYAPQHDYTTELDAMAAFGNDCTMIYRENRK